MAFNKIKSFVLLICATVLVGVSGYAYAAANKSVIHIGVFNTKKAAQEFYETLPPKLVERVDRSQLWMDVFKSNRGFLEHHINVSNLNAKDAQTICAHVIASSVQCVVSQAEPLFSSPQLNKDVADSAETLNVLDANTSIIAETTISGHSPKILDPLGIQLETLDDNASTLNLSFSADDNPNEDAFISTGSLQHYGDNFSLESQTLDSPSALAAKSAYDAVRNNFLTALQNTGEGINAGVGDEAARDNLIALGQKAFEAAGNAYLSGYLEGLGQPKALASDANAGQAFIHHVQKNIGSAAQSTVSSLVNQLVSGAASGQDLNAEITTQAIDNFFLSGARGLIDSGLSAARRSDLYVLRNLEFEYNLNNFDDAFFSVLATQPVYQTPDLRHNIFLQGGGIINEQSVDIDDDTNRHTINFGAAYRYLTVDEKYLLGGNVFIDHQFPFDHTRLSIGADAKAENLNLAANYYIPLTGFRDGRRDEFGTQFEEQALEGFDLELGYTPEFLPELSVFGRGYNFYRETDDDLRGLELSTEYSINKNFTLRGAIIEENGGRDGVELALQYRVPLYDADKPNLALADINTVAENPSVRSRIFEKVRRENRIRVEERTQDIPVVAPILSAQFNASSIGLPFDVGGVLTGAGVDLPFDTVITVPNGDFSIINFSNGAIANISASGGGDVILEFNASTLTVNATNGGFVQFISASGGINTVNVPGGIVNLLGTDIDVTDDGTITTVQVRSGQIEVVPDIGSDTEAGNQSDIVSLGIATGVTSLLIDPTLTTRREAAFTNLDLINPDPPVTAGAAPFINAAPALVTGPQFVGDNADIQVNFTQPVTVAGVPFLNGLVGVNTRQFDFNAAASSSTQLIFRYTYIADDVGAVSLTVDNLDLNGGTIVGTGNGLNALTEFVSTVMPINDLTSPSLISSTPVDDDPAFAPSSDIVLIFNEDIQAGIGNIFITDTTDGSDTRIIPIGDPQITIVGNTLTINPTVNLDLVNDFDVIIAPGVIEDTAGNDFAGIASGDLNFTTANGTTPLFVSVTPPTDGTFTAGQDLDWILTYDQAVTVAGGTPTIDLTLDSGTVQATFTSGSGTPNLLFRYTITPADADADGVVLTDIVTLAGATLVDTISGTQSAETDFTAVKVATPNVLIDQAPILLSSTPVEDATDESIGIDVTLAFNENVQAGTGNIVFTDTDDGSDNFTIPVTDPRVSFSGSIVTIDLSAQLLEFNTNYEVTTSAGVFEDIGVLNLPNAGIASGDVNWQTIVNPIAGFPAPTISMLPGTIGNNHENAQNVGTWQMTIDVGPTPDGVIFESGASGQGIAASFGATDLVFAAGDGDVTATNTVAIFGSVPISSIPPGLHDFVFVANPDAPAEIGLYIDGIRVIDESIPGSMQGGEWAGTNGAGYGMVNNAIRSGVDTSAINGATLNSNLSFYTNIAPSSF